MSQLKARADKLKTDAAKSRAESDLALTDEIEKKQELEASLMRLQDTLVEKDERIAGLTSGMSTLERESADLKEGLASLEAELESRQRAEESNEALASRAVPEVDIASLDLSEAEENYVTIQRDYARYAVKEDLVLKRSGETGLFESRLYLDEFLNSEPLKSTLPGLWERIERYDRAYKQVGREDALQDVINIVYDLSEFRESTERAAFLDEEIALSMENQIRVELLEELKHLVRR